ncbi:MAG: hypothetical protein KGV44_00375 [Flavobacteriaceae bacterium]|nr:hypothetical protein [Flavobacteriaceae bacterium]
MGIKEETYCLHHIANYYGLTLSKEEIQQHFCSLSEGRRVVECQRVAEKIGFQTHLGIGVNHNELKEIPTPAILFGYQTKTTFLIIEKVGRWFISIICPKTGKKRKIIHLPFLGKYVNVIVFDY